MRCGLVVNKVLKIIFILKLRLCNLPSSGTKSGTTGENNEALTCSSVYPLT